MVVTLLPVMVVTAYHVAYWNKVVPRINVAGKGISNLSFEEASHTVSEIANKYDALQPALTLTLNGNEWYILKAEIGFEYLSEETARKAFSVGRSGILKDDLIAKWESWFRGERMGLDISYSEEELESRVASIAAELDLPPVPPTIELLGEKSQNQSSISVFQGEPGHAVEQDQLIGAILGAATWGDQSPIEIPLTYQSLDVSEEQIEAAKARAEKLLDKTLTLTAADKTWELTTEELIDFLDFEGGYDQERLGEYLKSIAEAVDRPAQDAAFAFMGGRVTEFRAPKEGYELNQETSLINLSEILLELESGESSREKLALELFTSEPSLTLADVNDLGLSKLLGRGTSTYHGSDSSRVYNVGLSAQRVSGVLIAPGDEFSFNANVGEISGVTGYKSAYIIKSGSTVLDDGGGVCQTSTTVFRAALDAGLPITERRAHSYRVGYYEQNAKAGLDATIYSPTVDLKFLNDTPAHILVQTIINGPSGLIVEIYGTDDGRVSQITNHRVWDVVPAPPPRYQDDPSLAPGEVKQVDFAASGAKAKFDYIVTKAGETMHSKTFYSTFRPWQAVYLRGV